MKTANPRNMAASVRQRLMNHASSSREDFQVVLAQFGFERLLYRLGRLHPVPPFTVKGALLFRVWTGEQYRPTRDLDLASPGPLTEAELRTIFRNACTASVEDDGLVFAADAVHVQPIREDAEYGGMRVTMEATLGRARIPLQIDIGFGDAITPRAATAEFPALLEFPAPLLAVYPRETAVAEKTALGDVSLHLTFSGHAKAPGRQRTQPNVKCKDTSPGPVCLSRVVAQGRPGGARGHP